MEHGGKAVSIGESIDSEYIDRLTNGAKVDLLGGGSMTLGQAIAAEIRGYMEECWRLLDAVMLARRLADAVITMDGERLDLAYELLETTECWDNGDGPTLADAEALADRRGIALDAAGELIKGRTAYPPLYAL